MSKIKKEIKILYGALIIFFIVFLILPVAILVVKSFQSESGFTVQNYLKYLNDNNILNAISNSVFVSFLTAIIVTTLAFILAYAVNFTRIFKPIKKILELVIVVPMLLPTITYGFAIIYSFGKQGLLTNIFGREVFEIYGINGLLMGYVIYTLPAAFLLINNSFRYIDKKFITVSNLMGDSKFQTFKNTIFRPLIGSVGGAFVLSFILSFTDFGIPAAVGGNYEVISTSLYRVMLGSIPDFNGGAVIAIMMLIPAVFGIIFLNYLEKFNFNYDKITNIEINKNKFRDIALGLTSVIIISSILGLFLVMFITPFMMNFPYDMTFTLEHFNRAISSNNMLNVFKNSLIVSVSSAILGTIISYSCALLNTRSNLNKKFKSKIDVVAMITNTIPGMVLGLSYLLLFNKSSLKGTFLIIIISNIVHFFATPYLMAKNSLNKMNRGFEVTGELMGDSFVKTIFRIIIPNSLATVIEMVSYYFINSMVTISAIIFLVSSKTAVITTKIKELQHYAKFNEIFILSILIFITNIIAKIICENLKRRKEGEK